MNIAQNNGYLTCYFSRLLLNFEKMFSDFCHWQQPLSEIVINQSADLIIYRVNIKLMFYEKGQ